MTALIPTTIDTAAMTARLDTLPNEILDDIFRYLADDKFRLARLALLCRRFCQGEYLLANCCCHISNCISTAHGTT
jgi:hypothetical protein